MIAGASLAGVVVGAMGGLVGWWGLKSAERLGWVGGLVGWYVLRVLFWKSWWHDGYLRGFFWERCI